MVNHFKLAYSFTIVIDEDDLHGITEDIEAIKADYFKLGHALKLKLGTLNRIKKDSAEALIEVIHEWLKKNYDWNRHGRPTWKALVKAVASPMGGNNIDLAIKIANGHQAG